MSSKATEMSFARNISRGFSRAKAVADALVRFDRHIDDIKIAQGRTLCALHRSLTSRRIRDFEFRIFSQWGEDGIIQKLVNSIEIENRTFIEFGVEDFRESNCRFLMMKDNWSGFVVDGSTDNVRKLEQSYYYWKYDLRAVASFVSRENIDDTLRRSGFPEDLGILSIDIDGADYHVLEAIRSFKPRILIAEYNSVFGPDRKITVPYDATFTRTSKHYSNLYFGSSLGAIDHLARRMGYTLVGVNSEGVNGFFVRNDLMTDRLEALSVEEAYVESRFRESRGPDGIPDYRSGAGRLELIKGLPVIDVESGKAEVL